MNEAWSTCPICNKDGKEHEDHLTCDEGHAWMQDGTVLINRSRAESIDARALIDSMTEHKLSSGERKKMPKKDFVFKKEKRYPIEDKAHARNALSRVSQHGSPAEKKKVSAAVHRKYPGIGKGKDESLDSVLPYPSEDDLAD